MSAVRRFMLVLAFDGTDFSGWQRQPRRRTVQGVVESALKRITGESAPVHGCSRLDAGAHARKHVSHFDLRSRIAVEDLARALSAILRDDVQVLDVNETQPGFHARKTPSLKTYEYMIWNKREHPLWNRRTCLHVPEPLDLSAMHRACGVLIGRQDFASFQNTGSSVRTSVRTVKSAEILERDGAVIFRITAEGFLKQMVRSIVGTLISIGRGSMDAESMKSILETKRRAAAGKTVPARGLFLVDVIYGGGD